MWKEFETNKHELWFVLCLIQLGRLHGKEYKIENHKIYYRECEHC